MKRKKIALISVLCLAIFFLLAIFFMDKYSNHECVGSSCEICEEISICKKSLNEIGAGATIGLLTISVAFPKILKQTCRENVFCKEDNLITLKTKLSA